MWGFSRVSVSSICSVLITASILQLSCAALSCGSLPWCGTCCSAGYQGYTGRVALSGCLGGEPSHSMTPEIGARLSIATLHVYAVQQSVASDVSTQPGLWAQQLTWLLTANTQPTAITLDVGIRCTAFLQWASALPWSCGPCCFEGQLLCAWASRFRNTVYIASLSHLLHCTSLAMCLAAQPPHCTHHSCPEAASVACQHFPE